jgi:exosortase
LVVQRFRNDEQLVYDPNRRSLYGLLFLAASLLFYLYFLQNRALYLAAFAMIGMLAGLVWAIAGGAVLRKLAFPIGFLVLMVPLPQVDRVTLPLAMFTGVCSGSLVQFLGLDVTIVGNAVTLPNANLEIGAQCSGVNSLIALTSLMVLTAYLLDGPVWSRVALVCWRFRWPSSATSCAWRRCSMWRAPGARKPPSPSTMTIPASPSSWPCCC